MPTLTELHETRGRLVTQAREALDAITANTDDARTAELEARHDTIMAEFDKIEANIKREERHAQIEAQMEERQRRNRPLGPDVTTGGQNDGEQRTDEQRQAEYRDAFMAMLREGGDMGAMTTEQRQLLRAGYQELRTQTAGTNAAGGYTVPVQMANDIVQVMKDWGPMYDPGITNEVSTGGGNQFTIPTNDDTANTASALAEGADLTDDGSGDAVFGQARFDAYVDATPWVKISFELLQDSAFDIQGFISGALGERLGRRANARLTTGSGVNQPNGIVTAAPVGITAASAVAIASDELITFQHSVNQAYRRSPKARWMFADSTLAVLRKLKDGQGNYLWQMGDIRAGVSDMLLDKPYSINDDVPAIATGNKAIIFGDFSRYWVRKVGGPVIGTVRERFWPKVGLAGLIRYDGELVDAAAIKALKLA
ncbi:phage major capsid protein [Novosphingobium humi]|uniref:Phage major capsid protein n=1 Tax=Novosphingobium humi TaxID=2282397 RepID=A0ABY7U182_9SPHN|nr:phage major capsid protein [Novosphingobium humi]WCT78885.1 phage major capsid protein [Novosphingobium humi]